MQELPVFVVSPLVGLTFALSALVAAGVVLAVLAVRRRGRLCPRCGSTTLALVPSFPLKLLAKRVLSRWCSGCGWKGLALRPPHERRALDGKIHLKGGFRWGAPAPPPTRFFHWSGEGTEEEEDQPGPVSPPDLPFRWGEEEGSGPGPEPGEAPSLPFSWGRNGGDGPPPPPPVPFRFLGRRPPPLPFRFAEEGSEEPEPSADGHMLPEHPPPIPFRFAGEAEEEDGEKPDPDRVRPRLGFRWKR